MNKQGFTLIELLVTIALLAIMGVVIVSNLYQNLEKQHEKQRNNFINIIEKSACVYTDINDEIPRITRVSINELLTEGLLEESNLIDPDTNKSINKNESIQINYNSDGTKTCSLECKKRDGGCNYE